MCICASVPARHCHSCAAGAYCAYNNCLFTAFVCVWPLGALLYILVSKIYQTHFAGLRNESDLGIFSWNGTRVKPEIYPVVLEFFYFTVNYC